MGGGELIREARLRAGLTQAQLSELTGRERSVIARWEQGAISPPIDSLMQIIHACGFDLPLTLVPVDESGDQELREALLETPSERVESLLAKQSRAAVFDPYEILAALQARNVAFVVVGAFARVIHGTRERTDGIDITPSMRAENLDRLQAVLADLDAHGADRKPLDLSRPAGPVVELKTRVGELKLVPEPTGSRGWDDLRRRAQREPLGRGLRPRVAAVDDLARMLGALDRDQDLERLLRLRRLITLERQLDPELGRGRGIEV
jgi:transcriptional regulator with XRE-family HTH domain